MPSRAAGVFGVPPTGTGPGDSHGASQEDPIIRRISGAPSGLRASVLRAFHTTDALRKVDLLRRRTIAPTAPVAVKTRHGESASAGPTPEMAVTRAQAQRAFLWRLAPIRQGVYGERPTGADRRKWWRGVDR